MFWRVLSLLVVAGATATLFTSKRRRALPSASHEDLSSWESEGGMVPTATLSQQGSESGF